MHSRYVYLAGSCRTNSYNDICLWFILYLMSVDSNCSNTSHAIFQYTHIQKYFLDTATKINSCIEFARSRRIEDVFRRLSRVSSRRFRCSPPGGCVCSQAFAGADCSVRSTDPPIISTGQKNVLCNRAVDDCTFVAIFGNSFVKSDLLTCHFEVIEVSSRGRERGWTDAIRATEISTQTDR